ncbi:vps52 sac2 family protein [Moniliophthora roreri MCA 2997]|uniref:Vps52 sac2 family protein n=1 Tax=Moniliophthora roreri (strain MCA 2997) TaxID=1381753 RepID=V2X5J8_MONRO|nr:vps52 sac2 family protein [Moniliophthora roreri MCA 2997]KAI3612309.1 vps52 sac2 family protein [Moniliophthora roreri]
MDDYARRLDTGNAPVYSTRGKDFVELHEQVQTSVNLLDSLESFLSTFQKDLSAVSGQISELQDRSNDIDARLKSRRKIEKPLSSLLNDITIPPSLATTILDTDVSEQWVTVIEEFERHLDMIKGRARVKAARDLTEVAEGLRIVASTKLRAFFLALLQPIKNSVTTNMQVLQTSIFLKYRTLFAFLSRQALPVANEVQRAYLGAARTYYETGFRRYIRSLGWIKARNTDKFETIVNSDKATLENTSSGIERISNARLDGPNVTLAYMADDKTHKEPAEALLRSLLLVFMDNVTAEYAFLRGFFSVEAAAPQVVSETALFSPTVLSPIRQPEFEGLGSRSRSGSVSTLPSSMTLADPSKEEQAKIDALWKQVFDPVMTYVQTFTLSVLEPPPPVVSLLTMIRLTENVVTEMENRDCPPAVTFVFGLRLQLWPLFQKLMNENIEALKKLADGSGGGYFSRATIISEATVKSMCQRYIFLFSGFVTLTVQEEETMIFSNLLRLRQELQKLIEKQTGQISDPISKATMQSNVYEILLQGLNRGMQPAAHPKSQQELAYWAKLEEEARRKIISTRQSRR